MPAHTTLSSEQTLKTSEEVDTKTTGTACQHFSHPVQNGDGEYTMPPKTTADVCIKGYFKIKKPDEGTWTVEGHDGEKRIFRQENVKKDDKVDFKYKSGWTLNLRVKFTWSKSENTTIDGFVKYGYAPKCDNVPPLGDSEC